LQGTLALKRFGLFDPTMLKRRVIPDDKIVQFPAVVINMFRTVTPGLKDPFDEHIHDKPLYL
jgi:hypothetical protein